LSMRFLNLERARSTGSPCLTLIVNIYPLFVLLLLPISLTLHYTILSRACQVPGVRYSAWKQSSPAVKRFIAWCILARCVNGHGVSVYFGVPWMFGVRRAQI